LIKNPTTVKIHTRKAISPIIAQYTLFIGFPGYLDLPKSELSLNFQTISTASRTIFFDIFEVPE
jgi:hypothetical protein